MTYLVTKEITFDSGHRLSRYIGKCYMLHGHTYKLQVTVQSNELDSNGFVIDFTDLKAVLKTVTDKIDHRTLLYSEDPMNKELVSNLPDEWFVLVEFEPTVENIAKYLYEQIKKEIPNVVNIRLWETPTSFADYA